MSRLTSPANLSGDPVDDALAQFGGDARACIADLLRYVGELERENLRLQVACTIANEDTSHGYVRGAKQVL
ncbi:hypothetical protein NS365_05665 [Aureimonas ureilytica]|uniref:Uncharacterized protein n=1 Tax=Aureimonas ureilytica TaxID=401562 RepID=A0A175RVQ3_9HYPH|nr:hypothetical protein [Aureimonas ureilytica]KTR06919.1 hypothetical protein NS365_05665 [Aureimonas ureilytica]